MNGPCPLVSTPAVRSVRECLLWNPELPEGDPSASGQTPRWQMQRFSGWPIKVNWRNRRWDIEYDPVSRERRAWNAGLTLGPKRALKHNRCGPYGFG